MWRRPPGGRAPLPKPLDDPNATLMDIARNLVREPDVADPRAFRRRVHQLAAVNFLLLCFAVAGIGVIVANGRRFVLLAQRSNVETLTIAFFLLFFSYLLLLSARGAKGAALLGLHALRALRRRDPVTMQRKLVARLGETVDGPAVALSHALERADRSGQPFELRVADGAGSVGRICVDGVSVRHREAFRHGSTSMLAYFVHQITDVLGLAADEIDIVCWATIDAEGWHQYRGTVRALEALGRARGAEAPVWPRWTLTEAQIAELERRLSAICSAVREEAFLPRVEYEGEHKIPIIPEPLGILSLKRRERRVDPLSSMGICLAIVAVVTALLVWFAWRPPWVPGG
jgi:hypothetical protein